MNTLESITSAEEAQQAAKRAAERRAAGPPADPAVVAAARTLGAATREISSVKDTRAGVIVSFVNDSARMILVPENRPDGMGRTGVMFLDPPGAQAPGDELVTRPGWFVYKPRTSALARLVARPSKRAPRPTGVSHPPVVQRPVVEREHARALDLDPADDELAGLEATVGRLQEASDADPDEEARLRPQLAAARLMLSDVRGRRSMADAARADQMRGHPIASPKMVRTMVATIAWARVVLEPTNENERQRLMGEVMDRYAPIVVSFNPAMAAHELKCALKCLADHGLDEHGQPLGAVDPTAA